MSSENYNQVSRAKVSPYAHGIGLDRPIGSSSTPFFSIGIPTYNRRALLIQTISSVIKQTFQDFEVIVGNSYTKEALSGELLGVVDPRVRFVNYPRDQGVVGGYNALQERARGRYFTWLADDDLFAPDFLQSVYAAIVKFNFTPCVYTKYSIGDTFLIEESSPVKEPQLFSGRQFLHEYLARSLKVVGCYGAFDLQYIMRIGGMELLNDPPGISPYSDNLIAIRSGLLEQVVYIDTPLVFLRAHEGSISYTSTDLDSYCIAQNNLCCKCVEIFSSVKLHDDFNSNFFLLLIWCIKDLAIVAGRAGFINRRQAFACLCFVKKYLSFLKGSIFYWRAIGLLMKTTFRLVRDIGKMKITREFKCRKELNE